MSWNWLKQTSYHAFSYFSVAAEVFVRREAPLGDPIQINLRGYELSIRKSDAYNVKIITKTNEE